MFKKSLQIVLLFTTMSLGLKAQCPSPGTAAGSNITVCSGTDTTKLAATLPSGFTGTWTKMNFWDSETITSASSPTSKISGLNSVFTSPVSLIWTITDGANCKNIKDTIAIYIQTRPTTASAGLDKSICLGEAVTLNATAPPAGSIGYWSFLSGPNNSTAVIANPANRLSAVTGLSNAGTDLLSWTVTNATCGVTFADTMQIISSNTPSRAVAGKDVTACVGDTITLYGSKPTSGNPVWSRAGVTGANTNNVRFVATANNDTVKVALNTAGTYTLYYTVSVGATNLNSPCTSQDTLILTVKPALTVNAGIDQLSCDGSTTTFTVKGNKPKTGTGQWSILGSVTGSVTTTLDTVGTVTGLSPGINSLVWQIIDGSCTANDYMNIVVGPPTKAIAGDTIKICTGDTIQLIGSIAHTGIPTWTRASGVTTNNIAFVTNSSNDTVNVKVKTAGTFKMYYTIALGTTGAAANCFSRDSLIIKANAAPTTATIYGPATLTACDTSTTFILNANAPAVGETASWMLPNNLGVNFIPGSRHGKLTTQSATSVKVSDLPQGTTIVQYTITGVNGCTSIARLSISIGANAGADITVCQGNTAVHISGSATNGWTPLWSTQNSTIASIVGSATSANVTLSTTGSGKIHMVYTLIDAAKNCVSSDTMIVTALSLSECTTGIADNKSENLNMLVYPNPSNGIINILLKDDKTNFTTITVIALDGRVILAEQLGSVKDIQKEINLSNAAKGIYFIRLTKGEETLFSKVIVQ
jgi:hypothetical protein